MFFAWVLAQFALPAFGQGAVLFDTYVPGNDNLQLVDAPVFIGGTQYGPGTQAFAQLWISANGSETPLVPITTFGSTSAPAAIAERYVSPVVVTVPGAPAGTELTIRLRSWPAVLSYAEAKQEGVLAESNPLKVALGTGENPALLLGLQSAAFNSFAASRYFNVPEPSILAFGALAALASLTGRKIGRSIRT